MRSAIFLVVLLLSTFLHCNAGDLRNLVYWTPHKTGSTSMRYWLRQVASSNNFTNLIIGLYYPVMPKEDWHDRSIYRREVAKCAIIGGHINARRVGERRDERELGKVITTTRDVVDTYLSKYFHRTRGPFSQNMYHKSAERLNMLWYFRGIDPCEALRYYDGIPGCNLEEKGLSQRVENIVSAIDCAVDTDDAHEDVGRLCEVMQVKECASFPRNMSRGVDRYAEIKQDRGLRSEIERALVAANVLRDRLMSKKCAYLKEDEVGKWPFPGCESQ